MPWPCELPGHREGDQHEAGANDAIEEVVVGGEDRGGPHREGHQGPKYLPQAVRAVGDDGDAHQQVPANVEAGHGGELVRQGRRLQHAIGFRVKGYRVHEAEITEEPGRSHREHEEEKESHDARKHHCRAKYRERLAVLDE